MADKQVSSNGIGFWGLLGIVFITLKLTGVITWSWWWVTAPLWGGLALVLAIVIIGVIIFGALKGIDALLTAKRRRDREKRNAR